MPLLPWFEVATINMQSTVLIVHTLIALSIIILVLVQRGKGAEAGAAFGAGASGTVFGSRGSTNFFSRATAILATAFFATSLTLAYMSSQGAGGPASLLESVPAVEVEQQLPEVDPVEDAIPALQDTEAGSPEATEADVPPLDMEPQAEDAPPEE
jgi:preprotein translocase subunit SecG